MVSQNAAVSPAAFQLATSGCRTIDDPVGRTCRLTDRRLPLSSTTGSIRAPASSAPSDRRDRQFDAIQRKCPMCRSISSGLSTAWPSAGGVLAGSTWGALAGNHWRARQPAVPLGNLFRQGRHVKALSLASSFRVFQLRVYRAGELLLWLLFGPVMTAGMPTGIAQPPAIAGNYQTIYTLFLRAEQPVLDTALTGSATQRQRARVGFPR
jgi:hypothetical protein